MMDDGYRQGVVALRDMDRVDDIVDRPHTESLTDDLLRELLSTPSIDDYCEQAPDVKMDLPTYLNVLLEAKNLRRIDVIHAAGLNETFGYQIFKGQRHAGRNKIIQLAFALRCSLHEAQRLLRHAGVNELYCRNRRDAIIIFCLDRGFELSTVEHELFRFGENTLQDASD